MDTEADPHPVQEAAEAVAAAPPPRGLRLVPPAPSRWIEFPWRPGLRMRIKPLTSPLSVAAEARARRRVNDLIESGAFARADMDLGVGHIFTFQAEELGRYLIEEWEGVLDAQGKPVPVIQDAIRELMQNPDISGLFMSEARRPLEELAAEGEGLGSSPNGSSATGPSIAPAAVPPAVATVPPASPSP